MPSRDWRLRISDILKAIQAIQTYTADMDYHAFAADQKTVDAVLRNVEIIGEASSHVPEEIVLSHPEIPWKDMRDMRNVKVHAYFGVSLEIVWSTVQTDLPPLITPLTQLSAEYPL